MILHNVTAIDIVYMLHFVSQEAATPACSK